MKQRNLQFRFQQLLVAAAANTKLTIYSTVNSNKRLRCRTIGGCLRHRFVMFNKCHKDNSKDNNARERGLFLMLWGEWWLILWPNNGTATFLMLTRLHIHPQSSGEGGGRRRRSSFQGYTRHSLKSSLPAVSRGCEHIQISSAACAHPHCRAPCDGATVAKRIEKKKNVLAKETRRRSAWRSCDISGRSPIGQESPPAISKAQLPSSLTVYAPAKPPQPCEKWKMKNMMTSHTAAKRILIGFNCSRDWTQRSCCVRLIRGRLHPEGQS